MKNRLAYYVTGGGNGQWFPKNPQIWGYRLTYSLHIRDTTGLSSLPVEKDNNQIFNVFPNPSADNVTIQFSLTKAQHCEISIYDINGKTLKKIHLPKTTEGFHIVNLNISDYPNGIYSIHLRRGTLEDTKKVIKN
jgi:hypothetical protein